MAESRCRSCDAPIVWARTDRGKWMPLDPEPDPAGNVWWPDKDGEVTVLSDNSRINFFGVDPDDLYVSHFATCEDADKFRRKR